MADVDWNDRVLATYLAGVEEYMVRYLTPQVEELARMLAPVRIRRTAVPPWARRGYVGTPGHLKASVASSYGHDAIGFYGEVSALWYGRFMDPKARQLRYVRPFLPTALYSVCAGRTFYL